jgi:CBS domain-containing protein
MKVKKLMTTDVLSIGPEAPLKDVAAILAERRISGLPVVGAQGEVLGVVSEADILVKEAGRDPSGGGLLARLLLSDLQAKWKAEARTAGEAMSAPALTIGPEGSVDEAAARMLEHGVKRLPVVDEHGELVGIVTRTDLIHAFVRPDSALLEEITEEVLVRTLWLSPGRVSVTVSRGEVTLAGMLDSKADAELVEHFVERVPGVVAVRSDLRWEVEDARHRMSLPGRRR